MKFKINEIVWDGENKEYVKITNGIPVVEGKPEITPTEAVAIRFCGFEKDGTRPLLAFTYRKVNPESLSELPTPEAVEWFNSVLHSPYVNDHFKYLGRV